jgi:hypothetical protein
MLSGFDRAMRHDLEYEVTPGNNVPQGLPRLRLAVLSAVWRGAALRLEYPDGEVQTLVGWSGPGAGGHCELRVFWTRARPEGPAVALAIGGNAGLRLVAPGARGNRARGLPFLALADSLIPPAVRQVIGPPPAPEAKPRLLG